MPGLVVGRHTLSLDNNFNDCNPFQLKRSAGVGLRNLGRYLISLESILMKAKM